jgi:hypothetical protein
VKTEVNMDDAQTGARAPAVHAPARQMAGEAADAATEAAGNVTDTAMHQARQVGDEVSNQARSVAAEFRDQVGTQVRNQNDRLVDGVRRMADELDGMVADGGDSPARTVVARVAQGSRQMADYLAERGPEGVLNEVQDFARRRPGAFLATALATGFVVGRLGKGVFSATTEPTGPSSVGEPRRDGFVPEIPRMRNEPAYPTAGYPMSAAEPSSTASTSASVAATPNGAVATPMTGSESATATEYLATGTGRPRPVSDPIVAGAPFERGVASGSTGFRNDDSSDGPR